MKYVAFMCRTVKILISNRLRTRIKAGKTVAFDVSHHGHALVTLYVQFLCSDWSKFDRWVHAENLCSILKLFTLTGEADKVLCQLVTFLTVFFYWIYKMKFSWSRVFFYSLFIGFLVYKYFPCQTRKPDIGWHRFRFSPCLMSKWAEKSEAFLTLLDSFQKLHLEW